MRYEKNTDQALCTAVPENTLESRVIRDLVDLLLRLREERGADAFGPRTEGGRERWPLGLVDRSLEEVGAGWWTGRARASRPGPEGAPADLLEDVRFCDYQVALGYYPDATGGGPVLLFREREGGRASTAPFFAALDHPAWR